MEIFWMGVVFVGAVAALVFIKSLELGTGLTVALVAPLLLLIIYCLARAAATKDAEVRKDIER